MKIAFTTFLCVLSFWVSAQQLDKSDIESVSEFITCLKSKNVTRLSSLVLFPLRRGYPIPPVKDRLEFIKRFDQIFDDELIKKIVQSDPSKDWSEVGWRGISFENGLIWIDTEGELTAVNYHSKVEQDLLRNLIETGRKSLPKSLQEFKTPTLFMETSTYRIRVDDLGDGNYRYASWPIDKKMSEEPSVVINGGEWVPEGSGGNHKFEFKKDGYKYECDIVILGEANSPPAYLRIYRDQKEIFSESAIRLEE